MNKNNSKEQFFFKLIVIGDSYVGKTSIIRRYVYNAFEENSQATIGMSFILKEVTLKDKTVIKLKILDTAGQEKYRSMTKSFFKNADGVLFVFSLNDVDSFLDISEWINVFEENFSNNKDENDIPRYLIGNKSDLQINVSQDLIDDFLKNNNNKKYKYMRACALNNENIENIFKGISEDIYEMYKKKGNTEQQMKVIKLWDVKNRRRSNVKCPICLVPEA